MSFKFKNMLIIFQKLINNMLREYFNNFVIELYFNIFRKSKDTSQTCVQNTEKIKKENFVCETVKKQIQNSES